ncbi:hypothetical protein [Microlunatus parietis]|uniref:Tetratricopeptide (TPR) repeat protein n=1 Tax=Microlunatus parietis TaxID=682979 RepID=A0A7Y9I240_9ACTN|nr:hypothetical protein [Microlunatus parietis]NYE68814.1 tetratricopeptide (TPR) repeat protein [Microlunatus parietis]
MTFTRPGRTRLGRSDSRLPFAAARGPVAAGVALLLLLAGCTNQDQGPDLPPQRILQSVAVKMTPDSTMTDIESTTVSVRENAGDATTETVRYSPKEVADKLPVRVTTAYRTADRTGTNLNDLAGHNGRIEIDITVQNLTMQPENLTYDVAGTSRTQPALVGAPLTVVASTALAGVAPTDVITATGSSTAAATNGVLSRSENGDAVIQWAALLASPQMGANATLTLVADAKDFKVPTIDMSVQAGLVTDPSVSRVLESAFNTSPTSQLALEQRTIQVITDVNQVLTRASTDISKVRKNLDSTSKTLGTRSVKELQESTKGVATSMKALDDQLTQLNSDIKGTVAGAQSAVLQELGQTVDAMDKLLGDTSGDPPAPRVSGNGCSTVVGAPQAVGSVYGNLVQVSAQLEGYATASKNCKAEAQQVLLRSVGPAEPNAELCKNDKSTTCSIWAAEQTFAAIMKRLVERGDALIAEMQPSIVDTAMKKYKELGGDVKGVGVAAHAVSRAAVAWQKAAEDRLKDVELELERDLAGTDQQLADLDQKLVEHDKGLADLDQQLVILTGELDKTSEGLDALDDGLAGIHDDAEKAIAELKSDDPENPDRGMSVEAQIWEAAELACRMGRGGIGGGGARQSQVDDMRGYLVGLGCEPEDHDNNPETPEVLPEVEPPGRFDEPLVKRVHDQAAAWQKVADLTDEERDDSLYSALKSVRTQLEVADTRIGHLHEAIKANRNANQKNRDAIQKIRDGVPEDVVIDTKLPELEELNESVKDLESTIKVFQDSYAAMADPMNKFDKYHKELPGKIRAGFKSASDQAKKELAAALEPAIRKIAAQAEIDSEAVGKMFEESAAGLSNASEALNRNGARIIEGQRRELRESERRTAAAAAEQVDRSLSDLARGVSASTRDMDASFVLLQASLKKVLLDLGDRKVNGSGLLGSMTTSAARVGTADYQLALASGQTEAYANVRGQDINGILLQQAQLQAALRAGAELPAFQLEVPEGAESQTVYTFRIGAQ